MRVPGSFSTMKQVMPSGRARRQRHDARPLAVGHPHLGAVDDVLVAVGRGLLHRSAFVSLPASGSDNDRAPRMSPAAMGGSHRFCCSAVPLGDQVAHDHVGVQDAGERHPPGRPAPRRCGRRSSRRGRGRRARPGWWRRRGRKPASGRPSAGYSSACSRADATGMTSLSTKVRTAETSSSARLGRRVRFTPADVRGTNSAGRPRWRTFRYDRAWAAQRRLPASPGHRARPARPAGGVALRGRRRGRRRRDRGLAPRSSDATDGSTPSTATPLRATVGGPGRGRPRPGDRPHPGRRGPPTLPEPVDPPSAGSCCSTWSNR